MGNFGSGRKQQHTQHNHKECKGETGTNDNEISTENELSEEPYITINYINTIREMNQHK